VLNWPKYYDIFQCGVKKCVLGEGRRVGFLSLCFDLASTFPLLFGSCINWLPFFGPIGREIFEWGVTEQEVSWKFLSCEHNKFLRFLVLFLVVINFLCVNNGFDSIIVC
jgi:hypothetical protein